MAVLSEQDRSALWADFMRDQSTDGGQFSITKADVRAAVDALDQFFNDNAATINSAIPQPARGALSAAQKARLLVFVLERRYIAGA